MVDELDRFTDDILNGLDSVPLSTDEETAELQALILQLEATMQPAPMRAEFRSQLKQQLAEGGYDERVERATEVVDKAVNVFAVTAITSHIVGMLVVLVTFFVERGKRNRQAAVA